MYEEDLALNNLQQLICRKTRPKNISRINSAGAFIVYCFFSFVNFIKRC